MAIENGDFVRLNFTGKIKENDDVFDTTYEDVAKDAGIYVEEKTYKAIPIVVGGNHVLPAIEEAIEGLEAGDSKTIEIESENAFGKRNAGLIQLIPMKEFKKQGMTPVPGMQISSNGQTGKILTVNGGRVKVDFNHELAGKDLVYDVEVVEVRVVGAAGCLDRLQARRADRGGREALAQVGVVGVVQGVDLLRGRRAAEGVGQRGVALQAHAVAQAVVEDRGDLAALLVRHGLALDD